MTELDRHSGFREIWHHLYGQTVRGDPIRRYSSDRQTGVPSEKSHVDYDAIRRRPRPEAERDARASDARGRLFFSRECRGGSSRALAPSRGRRRTHPAPPRTPDLRFSGRPHVPLARQPNLAPRVGTSARARGPTSGRAGMQAAMRGCALTTNVATASFERRVRRGAAPRARAPRRSRSRDAATRLSPRQAPAPTRAPRSARLSRVSTPFSASLASPRPPRSDSASGSPAAVAFSPPAAPASPPARPLPLRTTSTPARGTPRTPTLRRRLPLSSPPRPPTTIPPTTPLRRWWAWRSPSRRRPRPGAPLPLPPLDFATTTERCRPTRRVRRVVPRRLPAPSSLRDRRQHLPLLLRRVHLQPELLERQRRHAPGSGELLAIPLGGEVRRRVVLGGGRAVPHVEAQDAVRHQAPGREHD